MTAGLTWLTRSPKPGGVAALSAAWAGAMKEVALSGEEPGAVASTARPSAATVPSSASRRGLRILRDVVVSELTRSLMSICPCWVSRLAPNMVVATLQRPVHAIKSWQTILYRTPDEVLRPDSLHDAMDQAGSMRPAFQEQRYACAV